MTLRWTRITLWRDGLSEMRNGHVKRDGEFALSNRRHVAHNHSLPMKPFLTCVAILALTTSPIQGQRSVHGVVFDDANGNGIQDSAERPLPGVVVSNQVDVVITDAARLELDEG